MQARLGLPHGLEEFGGRFGVQFQQFEFDLGIQEHRIRGRNCRTQFSPPRLVGEHRLVGVEDVQEGLRGEQREFAQQRQIQRGAG